jgi:hypothetical protein
MNQQRFHVEGLTNKTTANASLAIDDVTTSLLLKASDCLSHYAYDRHTQLERKRAAAGASQARGLRAGAAGARQWSISRQVKDRRDALALSYRNLARLCLLSFWEHEREHAILHLGRNAPLIDLV